MWSVLLGGCSRPVTLRMPLRGFLSVSLHGSPLPAPSLQWIPGFLCPLFSFLVYSLVLVEAYPPLSSPEGEWKMNCQVSPGPLFSASAGWAALESVLALNSSFQSLQGLVRFLAFADVSENSPAILLVLGGTTFPSGSFEGLLFAPEVGSFTWSVPGVGPCRLSYWACSGPFQAGNASASSTWNVILDSPISLDTSYYRAGPLHRPPLFPLKFSFPCVISVQVVCPVAQ